MCILNDIFQTKSFIKRTCGGDDANGGVSNSYIFLLKGKTKGTSHQLQALFDDQPWNEMKLSRLYESICVGFWRFPKGSLSSQWSSYNGMNNQPLHLANIDFFIHQNFIRPKVFELPEQFDTL